MLSAVYINSSHSQTSDVSLFLGPNTYSLEAAQGPVANHQFLVKGQSPWLSGTKKPTALWDLCQEHLKELYLLQGIFDLFQQSSNKYKVSKKRTLRVFFFRVWN